MNKFSTFVASTVAEAKYQLAAEQRFEEVKTTSQYHKVIDQMVDTHNQMVVNHSEAFGKEIKGSLDRVLHEDNYKEAWKRNHLESKWNSDDAYWDYLLSTAPVIPTKKKVNCSIKVKKGAKLPSSYIPSTPSASTTKYDKYNIYREDGRTRINNQNLTDYMVVNVIEYKKALVLDLLPVEQRKSKVYFDDAILQRTSNEVDNSSNREELNALHTYYIFRDEQLTGDGIHQLKQFLHSQKFVKDQLPSTPITVRDAAKFLIGHVVGLPRAEYFNFSNSTDNNFVFITNDIDTFDDIYREETGCEYQKISEYILKDKDEDGKVIPDTYEKISPESYMVGELRDEYDNLLKGILSYGCHKETLKA